MRIPFVGSSYDMEARSFDVQRSINLYPILSEVQGSKSVSALKKTPGLSLFTTAPGGPIRGGISSTTGKAFFVSAQFFVELNSDGSTTTRGTLNTQSGRVSICESLTEIMIVDGRDGWIFTKADSTFTQITDTDFPATYFCTYQDGYFIVPENGTQKFWISALNDGLTWDALDFTSVESSPDGLVAVYSDNGNLWCFGNRSVEVYQNTGNASFPFERIQGAVIQSGCEAPFTIQRLTDTLVWLGTDERGQGVVWAANGYRATRISTAAIERKIAEAGNFTTAYAFTYHHEGHTFYCLQISGIDTTLCFDALTNQWHERSYKNPETNKRELHRAAAAVFFNKKIYVGDRINGRIYEMSSKYYDDAGDEILWERICPHLQNEKQFISYASFELDMEVGVGKNTGQGSVPKIFLQYSDDGGNNFSSELWRDVGKIGEKYTRVVWRQLGQSRDRVFKVAGSDPVFVQLNDAYVNGT